MIPKIPLGRKKIPAGPKVESKSIPEICKTIIQKASPFHEGETKPPPKVEENGCDSDAYVPLEQSKNASQLFQCRKASLIRIFKRAIKEKHRAKKSPMPFKFPGPPVRACPAGCPWRIKWIPGFQKITPQSKVHTPTARECPTGERKKEQNWGK